MSMAMLGRIAAGFVLGAVLSVAAMPFFPMPEPAPRPHPVVIADSGGPLEEVVIHYTIAAGDLVLPTYTELFESLPRDVAIKVVVESQAAFDDLLTRLAAVGVERDHIDAVVTGYPITPWSRDRYTLARVDDRWLLLVPESSDGSSSERVNDWMVPWALAEGRPDIDVVTLPLIFDGGDLLVTEDRVLASHRLVEKNVGLLVASKTELITLLEERLGRRVFLFGDGPGTVPFHHVGMYVTPLPDGRIIVGDPDLGVTLLGLERALALGADLSDENLARFRAVARAFETAGFDVVRMPLIPLDGGLDYITYNNVLMETRDGTTIAYVPVYGIADLDAVALAQYAALGVDARPIDASRIYRFHGSVRCLVNVLRRAD